MTPLVVIPTRYEPERLRDLRQCIEYPTLILDNGHVPSLTDAVGQQGRTIYQMWNYGWQWAKDAGHEAVALLNDDIRILPGTLTLMMLALSLDDNIGVVYPDWPLPLDGGLPEAVEVQATEGTVVNGGMTGFCFMFRTDLPVPPFDEEFGWWCGDDAFEQSVRRAGYRVCRVAGLPCEHESDSERDDWARRPELKAIAEADLARWAAMP